MSPNMKFVIVCVLLLSFILTFETAPVQCAWRANALSFDTEEFWNEENTNVKYYYPQEETVALGSKVLFFRRIGRAFRKIGRAVGRAVGRVARAVGRVAKAVGKGIVKLAKFIAKPFVSLFEAIKGAKKKHTDVVAVFANYVGRFQKEGCSSQYVCDFDCSTIINCPVKPDKADDNKGFMDFTKDVQQSTSQKQAYKWVCKNSLFSGHNQRESAVSHILRKIAQGLTKVTDQEFESKNPNYSTTTYDSQFLKYLEKKKVDGNDLEILYILNDYKGLLIFSC
jgi:hypothetical protein